MLKLFVFLLLLSVSLNTAQASAQEATTKAAPITQNTQTQKKPTAEVTPAPKQQTPTKNIVKNTKPAPPPLTATTEQTKPVTVDGPKKNKVFDEIQKFSKEFNETNERHFKVLVGNYNLTQVVAMVRSDVSKAVQACGENNPDMKDAIGKRFETWTAAVDPVMKEADANINNMVLAQDYATADNIRGLFKFIDDDRAAINAEMKKVPVTTREGCQFMLEKMDETQPTMVDLLNSTLVSLPMMIQDESKREAKP